VGVQEVDRKTFKTNFQSRMELNRMVEWCKQRIK
jgi:hypothetical protein